MAGTDLLVRVQRHLKEVQDAPETIALDVRLLDTAEYTLLTDLDQSDVKELILQLYLLLPTLQQDPTPVVNLLSKLLAPVPLSTVLEIQPPVDFISGLDVAARPFNSLTLSLLEKSDASTARRLASTHQALFIALVTLWLSTEDEGVADQSNKVLLSLLRKDRMDADTVGWDGPVWKRIFRDKDVYERIFALTDLKSGRDQSLNRNRKTIAQARLMDWLPVIGTMDWVSITQSYHPEIESSYGLPPGKQSLLDYTALYLVDYKGDVLMHRTLIDFYSNVLQVKSAATNGLEYLVKHGIHARTLTYYVQPDHPSHDPVDVAFLYGPAAKYAASWASTYSQDFTHNTHVRDAVVKRIVRAVDLSPSRWAHTQSPAEDLHVLSSIPRTVLLSLGGSSPLFLIPSKVTNPDALHTLATVFHGPIEIDTIAFPPNESDVSNSDEQAEVRAAKDLYSSYVSRHERLWDHVVTHADTIALQDQALAAINLIKAVLTAKWNGAVAITEHPARGFVIPWLFGPPKTYANLVGGHGDAESAAYKIAMAKFDLMKTCYVRIKDLPDLAAVARGLRMRIEEGPWGSGGSQVGGRIATMEL